MRAWAGLETLSRDSLSTKGQTVDSLSTGVQAMSLSVSKLQNNPTTLDALSFPKQWPLVSSLHLGYVQSANVYRHLGMIRESIYFATQALKIVEAVDAKLTVDRTKVMLADLMVRSGETAEGSVMLESVRKSMSAGRAIVAFQIATGNLAGLNENFGAEIEAYHQADKAIDDLVTGAIEASGNDVNSEELAEQYDCQ